MPPTPILVSWSSGKNSAWTLRASSAGSRRGGTRAGGLHDRDPGLRTRVGPRHAALDPRPAGPEPGIAPRPRSRFPIPAPTVPTRSRHGHFLRRSSRGARRIPPGLRPPVRGGRESLPERPARRRGNSRPSSRLGARTPLHWPAPLVLAKFPPASTHLGVREPSSTPVCWTGPCSLRRLRGVPAGSCGVPSPPAGTTRQYGRAGVHLRGSGACSPIHVAFRCGRGSA